MTLKVFTSDNDFLALRPAWNQLHAAARGSVFQSFEWNETWRRNIGSRYGLRVTTQWDREILIGIAPCFLQKVSLGPVRVERMSLFGEAVIPGEYAPLMLPGREGDCAGALATDWREALQTGVADVIDLHSLPLQHTGIEALRSALGGSSVRMRYDPNSIPRMTIALPSNWEEYLDQLPHKSRANYRRADRELQSGGASYEVIKGPNAVRGEFPRFVDLHTRVWSSRGRSGYFTSRKGFEDFFASLLPALAIKDHARILLLRKGADALAELIYFSANRRACAYLSGRDPSVRTSAGVWLLAQAAREAMNEGCVELDLVEGYAPYKARIGAQTSAFARLSIWPPLGAGGWRGQLFVTALRGRSFLQSTKLPPSLARIPLRIVEQLKGKAIRN